MIKIFSESSCIRDTGVAVKYVTIRVDSPGMCQAVNTRAFTAQIGQKIFSAAVAFFHHKRIALRNSNLFCILVIFNIIGMERNEEIVEIEQNQKVKEDLCISLILSHIPRDSLLHTFSSALLVNAPAPVKDPDPRILFLWVSYCQIVLPIKLPPATYITIRDKKHGQVYSCLNIRRKVWKFIQMQ